MTKNILLCFFPPSVAKFSHTDSLYFLQNKIHHALCFKSSVFSSSGRTVFSLEWGKKGNRVYRLIVHDEEKKYSNSRVETVVFYPSMDNLLASPATLELQCLNEVEENFTTDQDGQHRSGSWVFLMTLPFSAQLILLFYLDNLYVSQ